MLNLSEPRIAYAGNHHQVLRPSKRAVLFPMLNYPERSFFSDMRNSLKVRRRCSVDIDSIRGRRIRSFCLSIADFISTTATRRPERDRCQHGDRRKSISVEINRLGDIHQSDAIILCRMLEVPVLQRLERFNRGKNP